MTYIIRRTKESSAQKPGEKGVSRRKKWSTSLNAAESLTEKTES